MSTTENSVPSLWSLLISSVPRVPWSGFIFGLFLPLTLLQVGGLFPNRLLGVEMAIVYCVLFFFVDLWRTKRPNMFVLITLFMISTQSAAHILAARFPAHALAFSCVAIVDESVLSSLFFVSLLTTKPLVLVFLDAHVLESIPEKIRKSSYHLAGWNGATAIWGVLYAAQAVVVAILLFHEVPGAKAIEFFFGWPIVLILLVLSVAWPRWYWIRHMKAIDEEDADRAMPSRQG